MREVRVAVIASLTPLEELDRDPFLVDTRAQHAMCARWAELASVYGPDVR